MDGPLLVVVVIEAMKTETMLDSSASFAPSVALTAKKTSLSKSVKVLTMNISSVPAGLAYIAVSLIDLQ